MATELKAHATANLPPHRFFFLLVTNGTAQLADEYQTYELQPAHLVTLTPSTKCMIQATSSHFQSMLLYLKPTFFDSLPDGQPLYEQLAHYLGHYQLPVFLLENEQATYLQKIFALFAPCRKKCSQLLRQYSEPLMQFLSSTDS